MPKYPGRIRVKITARNGEVWYATSLMHKSTPERTVAYLNVLSAHQKLGSMYELATEEQYAHYRAFEPRTLFKYTENGVNAVKM